MSPCSNGPTKIPSGATREEPGEVGLAHRERKGAHIVTVTGQHVEGVKLPLVIMLARVQRVEIGDAVDPEHRPRHRLRTVSSGSSTRTPRSTDSGRFPSRSS